MVYDIETEEHVEEILTEAIAVLNVQNESYNEGGYISAIPISETNRRSPHAGIVLTFPDDSEFIITIKRGQTSNAN